MQGLAVTSGPSGPARLLLVALILVAPIGALGCNPTFFAREAEAPLAPAPPPSSASLGKPPASALGQDGCSPRGCVPLSSAPAGGLTPAQELALAQPPRPPHFLEGKTSEEVARLVSEDLPGLGSMSFGGPTRGAQMNAVHLPEDDRWVRVDVVHSWGTQETVDAIRRAVAAVHREFPKDTPKLYIGDLSARRGGHLRPHISHQGGKDVDLGYYYRRPARWYTRAHRGNLDLGRSWALVRALIAETDVQYIFIDRRVQRLLRSYAESIGEDREWLISVFRGLPGLPAIIRHQPGHATHLHARFFSPVAEETARRCYPALLKQNKMLPSSYSSVHRVRPGETLIALAKRYHTTVRAIQRANSMRDSRLMANRSYYIPHYGPPRPAPEMELPPRRIPPARTAAGPVAAR